MALPINSTPIYSLTVPSTKKQIKFRPFLIKEEKALLIAQQSEDPIVMVDSLKEVIKSCIKDKEINVDAFATFDLEYVFTQIRARSVGEVIDLVLRCDTCADENATAQVKIDLLKLKVLTPENHNIKIELFDDVGITMKYPTMEVVKQLESLNTNDIESVFDIVVECIDYIYNSTEVFAAKDQSKTELMEFLNNLTSDQFAKVQTFFETMPKLKHEINYTCPVCKKDHHKVLEGLNSFF
jgi:ribosomal protein L44E